MDASGVIVGLNQPGIQARACIERIREALESGGFNLSDIVRLRIYVSSFEHIDQVARAQREAFGDIRPACTVVAAGLVAPEMLVYMDADARRSRPSP